MSEALNQQVPVSEDTIGSIAPVNNSLMNDVLRSRPAKILVGGAAFLAGLGGGAAVYASPANAASNAPIAQEAAGMLNDVGPALPVANLSEANQELKTELREEGPNSGLAREIAIGAGITTAAGRAKYITPGNVSLIEQITATNTEYPGDVGLSGEMPVLISNPHPSSTAFTIGLKEIPSESTEFTQLNDGEYVIDDEVIRGLCTNALFRKESHTPKPTEKRATNTLNVDVTYGVDAAASAYASAKSSSTSTSTAEVTCPDGSVVSAKSKASAEANAIAEALAEIKAEDDFKIVGKNLSYAKFQAEFNADVSAVDAAIAKAVTKASASSNVNIVCPPSAPAPTPTPKPTPTPPAPTPTTPKEGIEFQQQPPALEQIVAGASPTEIRINTITPEGYQVELVTLEDPDNGNCISTTSATENYQNPVEYDAWVTAANLPGCAGTDETLVAEVTASNGTNTITAETSMDVGAIQPKPNFGN